MQVEQVVILALIVLFIIGIMRLEKHNLTMMIDGLKYKSNDELIKELTQHNKYDKYFDAICEEIHKREKR